VSPGKAYPDYRVAALRVPVPAARHSCHTTPEAVAAAGVPTLLFISSLSAFEGCRSQYRAAKLAVERCVTEARGCNMRLGFV
jgi:hypothetical protein